MFRLLQLTFFLLIGFLIAYVLGFEQINQSQVFMIITHILLALGLYSSTFQIDLFTARKHIGTILLVITIGSNKNSND